MRDLQAHIEATPLADSHEHLKPEATYVDAGPDVLASLFDNYIFADLAVAGAAPEAIARVRNGQDPDVAGRWAGIAAAWPHCRHTGYGQAVRLAARLLYGMDEITLPAIEAAAGRAAELRRPGERLRLLRDVARLDHVQIDDFVWSTAPDLAGPDFFLYDLSWWDFCRGEPDLARLPAEVGIEVRNLATLRQAMEALYAKYGPAAVAVKAQHAYNRTLLWEPRADADAEAVLRRRLAGEDLSEADKLCLGDWCWARGVELSIEYNLPFKLHTGYYAGVNSMPVERIPAGHLGRLLREYPQARFVLMHLAYPYVAELVAMTKQYANTYADLCWAWSINPRAAADGLRLLLRAVPANKIFVFGGDTGWPGMAVAYAAQARAGLDRALQAEVDAGDLTEAEAIALATRLMSDNQMACFCLAEKKRIALESVVST